MKKQILKWSFLFSLSALFLTACDKRDGIEENEEEVITTMQLNFAPVGGGTALVYKFEDMDGPGGANPTIETIALAPNKSYNVTLQLLNKSVTPAEDITAEVANESTSHRFYYDPSNGSNISVSNLNADTDGNPLGITSTWTTTGAANGTVRITLRHYAGNPPNKAASDPVNSSKSSTDLEVDFTTRIQ